MSEPVLTILRGARELVAAGWGQGTSRREDHNTGRMKYCALGAIAAAGGEYGFVHHNQATYNLEAIVGTDRIMAWNDDPARTQAEVVDAFDKTIARLAGQEGG